MRVYTGAGYVTRLPHPAAGFLSSSLEQASHASFRTSDLGRAGVRASPRTLSELREKVS